MFICFEQQNRNVVNKEKASAQSFQKSKLDQICPKHTKVILTRAEREGGKKESSVFMLRNAGQHRLGGSLWASEQEWTAPLYHLGLVTSCTWKVQELLLS